MSGDARQNDAGSFRNVLVCLVTSHLWTGDWILSPMLASGLSCTPTCNEGYVQQGTNLQLVCERGVITSNIVCEAIPRGRYSGSCAFCDSDDNLDCESDSAAAAAAVTLAVVVTVVVTCVMHLQLIRIRKLLWRARWVRLLEWILMMWRICTLAVMRIHLLHVVVWPQDPNTFFTLPSNPKSDGVVETGEGDNSKCYGTNI